MCGLNLHLRNKQNEIQVRRDCEALNGRACVRVYGRDAPPGRPVGAARRPYHREPAECRRRGIIGMFFQFGADPEDRESIERITAEPVERKQGTEPNRCTAAQTPLARNLFHDRTGKRKGATTRLFKK